MAGTAVSSASAAMIVGCHINEDDGDGLELRNTQQQCVRLPNSEMLLSLQLGLVQLTDGQADDIVRLLHSFPCLFNDVPTRTNVLEHDINVGNADPIKQHPYRVNASKRKIMRDGVRYLLKNDLAILVPKPDGTSRLCMDYRKVNSVTMSNSVTMPDCIDTVGAATYVTELDLLKGYWQVPLTSRASDISAFVTPDNFLQYSVMTFGMRNAPATFQQLVSSVLAGVPNCSAYLDDLVIYSSEWSDHVNSLRVVCERLAAAFLTLNLAKCEFGKATVTYLSKEVGHGQVRPVDAKVLAITAFPAPTARRELRCFLGMVGYYCSFCKNVSAVVAPLTDLLSPARLFEWSPDCQVAFDTAKALLCNTPVLAAPDFERPFKFEVDASARGAGAVLLQQDKSGVDHPVCYFSFFFFFTNVRLTMQPSNKKL